MVCARLCHVYPYLPNTSARAGYDTRSIFKRSLTGFEFIYWIHLLNYSSPRLVASPRAEEPSLPYYLPIAGGRIIGFIPFPRVLVPCEMQSVSSRIWTHIAVSISYDDNHYTKGTSIVPCISHDQKSWIRLFEFHIVQILMGKVWIQLLSLQLWVNSRVDWAL